MRGPFTNNAGYCIPLPTGWLLLALAPNDGSQSIRASGAAVLLRG